MNVDVRLKRVDLVPEISSDVYRRMESERKRVANELRATGQAEGEKIKAELDDLLDEIDDVLEQNAEDFVKSYIQKGGE